MYRKKILKKNLIYFLLAAIYFIFGYISINKTDFDTLHVLPLFTIENKIPLLPWTAWIYVSDYFFLTIIAYVLRYKSLKLFFYSFITLSTIHFLIFIIYPTTYPRTDNWVYSGMFINSAFNFVRSVDNPINCFPSAHVGACMFGSFYIYKIKKNLFPFFLAWAILISISTLTIKQHYIYDIIGGTILALICNIFFFKYKSFKINKKA